MSRNPWRSTVLISRRDAEFGSLEENSWCRWVNLALNAVEREPITGIQASIPPTPKDMGFLECSYEGADRI
jgi:hypothetical protein